MPEQDSKLTKVPPHRHSSSDGSVDEVCLAHECATSGTAGHDYPPLRTERRTTVDTETAAYHLSRSPQTLRLWACRETGPVRPVRINGRLAWPVADLLRVQLGGAQ